MADHLAPCQPTDERSPNGTASLNPRSFIAGAVVMILVYAPVPASAQTILDTILSKVESALDAAVAARSAAVEMRTSLRSGIAELNGDLRELIDQAGAEATQVVQDERAGMEAFLPGGQCLAACTAFRAELVGMLTQVEALSAGLFDVAQLSANPDLSVIVAAIETAPGQALYPVYRVSAQLLASNLPERLETAVAHLALLRNVVANAQGSLPDQCALVLDNAAAVQNATYGVTATGLLVKLIGKAFSAKGETQFSGNAAVWGWVGGTIKSNRAKTIAEFLDGVSSALGKLATYSGDKLNHCTMLQFQQQTLAALGSLDLQLAGLNLDLSNLDVPVASRASQASVDNLQASVQTIGSQVTQLLDSQESASEAMLLRIQIERGLVSKEAQPSIFYLPASFGGLLEDVREAVVFAIQQHEAAGFDVTAARNWFERGDAALLVTDYRSSYSHYQSAYTRLGGH